MIGTKRILKLGILWIFIFISSSYAAFWCADHYDKLIRYLYVLLSDHKISFRIPVKYMYFVNGESLLSLALFNIIAITSFIGQPVKQIVKNVIVILLLVISSTLLICYLDSFAKLVTCTACQDSR